VLIWSYFAEDLAAVPISTAVLPSTTIYLKIRAEAFGSAACLAMLPLPPFDPVLGLL
jgi:hypothetical protein